MKLIVRHKGREFDFPLSPGVLIAGRDTTCDLTLDSRKVSRRHMSCTVSADEVIVRDLGSRNGIFVSDIQVKEARLAEGDEVKIGEFSLEFSSGVANGTGGRVVAPEPIDTLPSGEPFDEEETPPAAADALLPAVREGGQPQMLEESGRLYVVDPATGRRVEIVPVQPERVPQTVAVTTPGMRRAAHRKLVIALALFVLLLVVAAIYQQTQTPPVQVMSSSEYTNRLDDAIRLIDQSNGGSDPLKKAGFNIELCRNKQPKEEAAHILRDIAIRWPAFIKDVPGQGYEMEKFLREFKKYHNTPTGIEFANKYIKLIRRERNYGANVFAARKLIEEGNFEDALAKLEEMPEDSHYRRKYADFIAETRKKLVDQLKTNVANALRANQWNPAVAALDKLIKYDAANADAYKKQRATCTSNQSDKQALAEAKRQRAQREYDEALRTLKSVSPDGPYATEARNLDEAIQAEQRFDQAQRLYRAGQGAEAVKAVKDDKTAAALTLKGRIADVLAARQKALAAKAKGDMDAEREAWLTVTDTETDEKNAYRREALRELDRFRGRLKDLAEQHEAEGKAFYRQEKFEEARKAFRKALNTDPDQKLGKDWLTKMSREARLQYLFGLDKEKQGQIKAALGHFELAVRLGSAEDDFYMTAKAKVKKLRQ